jgi:dTDP-3-amino-3,4,6-trideoxy-alpha-D-glucose transaminase
MNRTFHAIASGMRIPFLDLRHHDAEIAAETTDALKRVLARGTFILGPEVEAFEDEWAHYCGCSAAAGVGNGTDAITLALLASGAIERSGRNEVITTPLTAGYTALGILNAGGRPVFADLDPDTYTIDPADVARKITRRTCAIVPVHVYGQMADMPAICDIARRHRLVVIEDAAQAHGARLGGLAAGASGDAAAFSFYPSKNLGALGDGGAVVSNDRRLIDRVKVLRQGGHPAALAGAMAGRNSRLDELQAAVLRTRLKHLDRLNSRRRFLARTYDELLQPLPRIRRPRVGVIEAHVYHLYVVRHAERDALASYLATEGIGTMVHYPYLLHQQPLFRDARRVTCVNAERVGGEILSLPLHPLLGDADVRDVAHRIMLFESRRV